MFKRLEYRVCTFQFLCRFAVSLTFRLSNRTLKITRILTHNLHTFEHNTLINELLRMQFYLFNIRLKLHHRELRKLRVTLPVNMAPFLNFTSSLLMQFFV